MFSLNAKGVNDSQVGDILRFAVENLDIVRGVNFQPIAFTGRINQSQREEKRITVPDVLKLAEEQTNGEIPCSAWYPISFQRIMHFQDLYNIDLERVKKCGVHYATPDGRLSPFCTYNIFHRDSVESKFSMPYTQRMNITDEPEENKQV